MLADNSNNIIILFVCIILCVCNITTALRNQEPEKKCVSWVYSLYNKEYIPDRTVLGNVAFEKFKKMQGSGINLKTKIKIYMRHGKHMMQYM